MKLKKNTNVIIIELALLKELKPYLVLYQYLNCLLKASIMFDIDGGNFTVDLA